ncbi:sugar ABC transporter permease [Paenarthrobacter sp. NPDC089316]|uniref:carbohydrate ABC transporter permease n=1 Tax=unclassified Paenarthrobacter TaxID=2634190 RepID=UPI00343F65DF
MTYVPFLIGTVALPAAVILLTAAGERVLIRFRHDISAKFRPWLWLSPLIIATGVVVLFPIFYTFALSFKGQDGTGWVGLDNFAYAFGEAMRPILLNNLVWLIALPLGVTAVAVLLAVLIDRIRWEALARTILVLPTAVSLVAGAVTWRNLYAYAPPGRNQLGIFNAMLQGIGLDPVAWTSRGPGPTQWLNNVSLVVVAVWAFLGIALLVLSAAVKSIPEEMVEAARLDGATEWSIFVHITLPSLWPSILTVITTQAIFAIKIFDIVYVMTNGNNATNVVGNQIFSNLFNRPNELGHAAALAVVLLAAAAPIIWFNIRSVRQQGATS